MNFYKHWIGDYQRDTADLSLVEHGAYRLLLDAYYANDGEIPADYGRLYRIVRAYSEEEQLAVRTIADRFFPANPVGTPSGIPVGTPMGTPMGTPVGMPVGKRTNARADREIEDAQQRAAVAAENGRRGGRKSVRKADTFSAGNPEQTQQEPSGLPDGVPSGITSHSHSHSHSHSSLSKSRSHSRGGGEDAATAATQEGLEVAPEEIPMAYRLAYLGLRDTAANAAAFDALIRAYLSGMRGKVWAGEDVGRCLLEFWNNEQRWNAGLFNAYLQKHARAQERNAALDAAQAANPTGPKRFRYTLTDEQRAAAIAQWEAEDRAAAEAAQAKAVANA